MKTKTKRNTRESRNQAKQQDRRNRLRALLVQLGLWNEFPQPHVRTRLLNAYCPKIKFSAADEIPVREPIETLLRELETAIRNATFDCRLLGRSFSIDDYFAYVRPLADTLGCIQAANLGATLQLKLQEAVSLRDDETTSKALDAMYYENLHLLLTNYGKLDGYIYFLSLNLERTPGGRLQQHIVLNRAQPERRMIAKGTERRAAYRCGVPVLNKVEWAEWPSSVLGMESEEKTYPVYVQRHVLERLYDRGGDGFYGKGLESGLQYFLSESLCDPKIHSGKRNDGTFLVEYHLLNLKIGYLVARKLDDLILVETFLFLTMDGTPEGIELKKQLKLERAGKQYTGLDRLWTFMCTDLALDPDLVEILTKCNCGDLFKMRELFRVDRFRIGDAADIRKYLRLKT